MTKIWNPSIWEPSLTIIDLLEKNKSFGGAQLGSVDDAVRYITRTTGLNLGGSAAIEALSKYIGRDGAAWVEGVNFHSKNFAARIKELELAARAHPRASKSPFGLLVLSTGTTLLPKSEQIERLKKAGSLALRHLGVGRNRAFFAIHDDTKNLHLHIIYCRFDTTGRLTEREPGKFRRYLLEDLTARIAYDLGYRLEHGADTRPNDQGELVDRVSNRVVRDASFNPVLDGCKERNRKRQLLNTGHKLEMVVMAACSDSRDLLQFRRLLAEDGIGYINSGIKTGGGAVFVDADGSHHKASAVNRSLARGKIFRGAFKTGLPHEPCEITLRREQQAAAFASAFASQNGADAPTYAGAQSLTVEQQQEADRRAKRGYSDEKPGAPRKIDMGDWPSGFPSGGIRAPTGIAAAFTAVGIAPRTRPHHIELWRNDQLIALQRSDQIVVYSRDKDDMRCLLIAAHKQWGPVELTGNSKFKARMADLAAELDIPITNPELTLRIEKRRSELKRERDRQAAAEARFRARIAPPSPTRVENSDREPAVLPEASPRSNLDRNEDQAVVIETGNAASTVSLGRDQSLAQSRLDSALTSSPNPTSAPAASAPAMAAAPHGLTETSDQFANNLTSAAQLLGSRQAGDQENRRHAVEKSVQSSGPLRSQASSNLSTNESAASPNPPAKAIPPVRHREQPAPTHQSDPERESRKELSKASKAWPIPTLDGSSGVVRHNDRPASDSNARPADHVASQCEVAAPDRIEADQGKVDRKVPPERPVATIEKALLPLVRPGPEPAGHMQTGDAEASEPSADPAPSSAGEQQTRPRQQSRSLGPLNRGPQDNQAKLQSSPASSGGKASSSPDNVEARVKPQGSLNEPADAGQNSEPKQMEGKHSQPSTKTPLLRLLGRRKLEMGRSEWSHLRDAFQEYNKLRPGPGRDRLAYTINARLNVPVAERRAYPELANLFTASDRNLEGMKGQEVQKTLG